MPSLSNFFPRSPQVEQTKFDELEEVYAELKLKQLLWDAIDEWDLLFASWVEADFTSLDPEELNAHTLKYGKSVSQLEKGLPPNPVVPKLKERVESMRDKLPVITNLRNPTLKPRHWDSIEEVIKIGLAHPEQRSDPFPRPCR